MGIRRLRQRADNLEGKAAGSMDRITAAVVSAVSEVVDVFEGGVDVTIHRTGSPGALIRWFTDEAPKGDCPIKLRIKPIEEGKE